MCVCSTYSEKTRMLTARADADVYSNKFIENWGELTRLRKPVIAAVSGYAVRVNLLLLGLHLRSRQRSSAAGASSR